MKKIILVLVVLFFVNVQGINASFMGVPINLAKPIEQQVSRAYVAATTPSPPPQTISSVTPTSGPTQAPYTNVPYVAPPPAKCLGLQTRTRSCTSTTCKSYTETQSRSCTTPNCPPKCKPDYSCASSTCIGSTCSTGCGTTGGTLDPGCANAGNYCTNSGYNNSCYYCTGTKVDSSWSPSVSTYCSGYSFTQIGNNGCSSISAVGTKTCTPSYCNTATSPLLYCSNNDVYGIYSYWNNTGCSVSTCQGSWSYNSCGDYKAQECGSDTCNTSGPDHEYCQNGNIWAKYDGTLQGCSSSACYNNHQFCSHYEKEVCAVGYTCKVVGTDDADCVAKSATWTEN